MAPFSRKKDRPSDEPPPITTPAMSPITEESTRKDSASLTSPTKPLPQPLPTRTPSTRFHEPVTAIPSRQPSQSTPQRSASTKNPSHPNGHAPERPGLQRRRTTAQTRYIDMLLELDNVPKLHNILASLFTWVLLAGYIVFPATFTNLQEDKDLDAKANTQLKKQVLRTARNIPLLYIAAFACGIGVLGCVWLWWAHRRNYVWVINRIFLPALMNSVAGLISTLVNVYSAQDGQYSVTARATIIVTSACSVVTALLFLLYNTVMLALVKRKHVRETRALDREMNVNEDVTGERDGRREDVGGVV